MTAQHPAIEKPDPRAVRPSDSIRVRIVTDDRGMMKVLDAETGKPIERCTAVTVHAMATDPFPRATVSVLRPELDITADAKIVPHCPRCGHPDTRPGERARLAAGNANGV